MKTKSTLQRDGKRRRKRKERHRIPRTLHNGTKGYSGMGRNQSGTTEVPKPDKVQFHFLKPQNLLVPNS